ncbi:hypothetical protein VTJ83DRAFT_403 [Remersonia thermophila]|uniref:Protein SYM1 n=1 Tax=Remersonia thermophila TaxID=72144 RepID=A0ABR4DL46_9PEZI
MFQWYQARLAARPLLTQAATTSLLFAVGDIAAQQVVDRRGLRGHDYVRTGRMLLYGGVIFGPCAATWFRLLSRHVRLATPTATTLARVACDQGAFAPVFIGVFLSSMAVLEGGSPRDKLRGTYRQALLSNWMVWPFVQVVNFALVPLQHRLLFVNVVSVGWNCWLSFLNSKEAAAEEKGREE